jgi:glucuronate isomerase
MSSTTSYVAMSTPETSASSLGMPLSSPAPCGRCSTGSAPTPRFRVILFTSTRPSTAGTGADRRHNPFDWAHHGGSWTPPRACTGFREFTVETAGFYNTSGFVDDTRAYASIPARHDLFRRVDAGYLARLILEHRLNLDEAVETAVGLTYNLPKESYRRP